MTTAARVENAMCEAVPGITRKAWATKRGCASHSSLTIVIRGVERHVCRMHEAALLRAIEAGPADLAALLAAWGWQ